MTRYPLVLVTLLLPFAASLRAQDTRAITEPTFPATCKHISAPLQIQSNGFISPSTDNDIESATETAGVQTALNGCTAGQAVELTLGASTAYNAFLINPLTIPAGVSLLVDGGVTVFGSRDPVDYQVTGSRATCGVNGTYQGGCKALLTYIGANSGLYGYGVVDARGYGPISTGVNAGQSWWLQTATLATSYQNIPMLMAVTGDNFTAYKITLRNSPFWDFDWTGNGLTVWGVKIEVPWNIPNTDGIDITGTNVTVNNTTISNGDDQIAMDAFAIPTSNITIENVTGYSRNGISIGSSTEKGVSNVLVDHVNLTGDVVSLNGTTVNGVTEATLKSTYGLTGYAETLPTISGHLRGLNLKTTIDRGGTISNVHYSNICIQDVNLPLTIQPYQGVTTGTLYPVVSGIVYNNVHMLAPSAQYVASPDNTGARYLFDMEGYPPMYPSGITFDNVVYDDLTTGGSSLQTVTAIDNSITTQTNVYPALFDSLAAPVATATRSTIGNTSLVLEDNSYLATTSTSNASLAFACPSNIFPFTVGELYLSTEAATNLASTSITAGGSITINAMVQPVMSQTTLYIPNSYNLSPGTVAVGAPTLTAPVTFYEGTTAVGTATLGANGTLAAATISNISTGSHTYTARYPGDTYYAPLAFGSVQVTAAPIATGLSLALTSATIYAGGSVLLTATTKPALSGVTVTFSNGSASVGTASTNSAGVALYTFQAGTAGSTASLSAGIVASGNYAATTSTSQTLTVVSSETASLTPTTLNIPAGSSASSTVTLTPGGGYSGAVSVQCSSPVSYIICAPSKSSVSLNGVSLTTFTQTITVAATTGVLGAQNSLAPVWACLGFMLFGITCRRRALGAAVACFALFTLAGCGKGSSSAATSSTSSRPSGTQTVTLNTSAPGAATQTFTLTINIQ